MMTRENGKNQIIGVTMGDVAGVGPEILVRAYQANEMDFPFVVYGDSAGLRLVFERLGLQVPVRSISAALEWEAGALNLIDVLQLDASRVAVGRVDAHCGAVAIECIERATRSALAGEIAGIATLPVSKEACRLTQPDFQGHTELIAKMCGVENFTLMLAAPDMIATHISTHVSMCEAIERVKKTRILEVIRLTAPIVQKLRGRARLAVAGLNAHAGEGGAFGREEIDEIVPAVRQAQIEGFTVVGPLPPDTVFMRMLAGEFDAVVCMYHDQGHIAMKLRGIQNAINVTVGLPIVRTSVDHGTAFDIAYRGEADPCNFVSACKLCRELALSRFDLSALLFLAQGCFCENWIGINGLYVAAAVVAVLVIIFALSAMRRRKPKCRGIVFSQTGRVETLLDIRAGARTGVNSVGESGGAVGHWAQKLSFAEFLKCLDEAQMLAALGWQAQGGQRPARTAVFISESKPMRDAVFTDALRQFAGLGLDGGSVLISIAPAVGEFAIVAGADIQGKRGAAPWRKAASQMREAFETGDYAGGMLKAVQTVSA